MPIFALDLTTILLPTKSAGFQNYRLYTNDYLFDKFEMIFSSWHFFKKMNEKIRLYYLLTCFRSIFGRKWRHQRDISKLTDLPLNHINIFIDGAITTEANSAVKEESPEEITATITTNSTRKI